MILRNNEKNIKKEEGIKKINKEKVDRYMKGMNNGLKWKKLEKMDMTKNKRKKKYEEEM